LAEQQDRVLERLARHDVLGACGPLLNEESDAAYWLQQPGAPKPQLDNEKPAGETVPYDELIRTWQQDASGEA
jgi:glycerol transport system substrate-binding protein